ncbi:MAG: hypothetical protein JWM91_5149 [Rhodospirillales bacterium]|nr:hypothetical protein [Rhodospirillales bacterium]
MKLGRFSAILDAYGAAPERWPAHEREAALELARSSLPAARALSEAHALDTTLLRMSVPDIESDPERFISLRSAIVSAAQPRIGNWFDRWLGVDLTPSQLWPSVAGLTVATLLGFAVGLGGLIQIDPDHDADDVAVLSSIDLPAASQ